MRSALVLIRRILLQCDDLSGIEENGFHLRSSNRLPKLAGIFELYLLLLVKQMFCELHIFSAGHKETWFVMLSSYFFSSIFILAYLFCLDFLSIFETSLFFFLIFFLIFLLSIAFYSIMEAL